MDILCRRLVATVVLFASIAYGWMVYMPTIEGGKPELQSLPRNHLRRQQVMGTWSLSKTVCTPVYNSKLSANVIQRPHCYGRCSLQRDHSGIDAIAWSACRGDAAYSSEECRWWVPLPNSCQTALFADANSVTQRLFFETHWMGDSRAPGTLLYKGNTHDVPQ